MNLHDALGIVGLLACAALLFFAGMLARLIFRARAAERRERALPKFAAGRLPLNPALWDGKNALDRADAASREVVA
jgi:hypothetical protein